jgi:hypothetical protein
MCLLRENHTVTTQNTLGLCTSTPSGWWVHRHKRFFALPLADARIALLWALNPARKV